MMIKDLKITNFRKISKIQIQPKALNIFVGPNNTGKSSILQAIALLVTSHNEFYDSLDQNILNYLLNTKRYKVQNLIYENRKTSEIIANLENIKLSLKIEFYKNGLPQKYLDILSDYFENYIMDKHDFILKISKIISQFNKSTDFEIIDIEKELKQTISRLSEIQKLFFERSENDNKTNQFVFLDKDFTPFDILKYLEPPMRFIKIKSQSCKVQTNSFFGDPCHLIDRVHRTYKTLVKNSLIHIVIEKLKENGIVEDIRTIDDEILIYTKEHEKPTSLNSMGDGFIALLDIIFVTTIARNGIIIYDEPNIFLHPYYISFISSILIDNLENSQFFISTHNIDFIEELLTKAKERGKLNDICIYRLHYRELVNKLDIEEVNGPDAFDELEKIGVDFRLT